MSEQSSPGTTSAPVVKSFTSGQDDRCLQVWFDHEVTADTRKWLLDAINGKALRGVAQGVSDSGKLSDPCEIKRRITRAMDSTSDPVTKSDLRDIVAVLAPSSNPRLVKALHDLRVWLETEGCSDQVETIDDALVDCGIFEVRCANCDGVGEWDEGPLAATSRHQISPDYRHMVCSDCSGTGIISIAPAKTSPALTSTDREGK